VLGRKVIEGQQLSPILAQALAGFGYLALACY
jgi:hypothetical protein